MIRDKFILDEHNQAYNGAGYIHIPGFLSGAEVDAMKKLYSSKEKSYFDKGFHRTLDLKNIKKKRKICEGIDQVVTSASERYLRNYRFLLTSFMTKEKEAPEFEIHQNWCFVDEDYFNSLVIWIPLQDTGEGNGTLYFLPGSDRFPRSIRGNNIDWAFADLKSEMMERMVPLDMKAGDAVIFDDATIHHSSPNTGAEPRVSIAQVMVPHEAQPVFYHYDTSEKQLQKYAIDRDFYLLFMNKYVKDFDFNDQLLLETGPLEQSRVTLEQLDAWTAALAEH